MGITIHFSANDVKEKAIDDIAEYWKKEIGKAKKSLPKEFFPNTGFNLLSISLDFMLSLFWQANDAEGHLLEHDGFPEHHAPTHRLLP
jgi:hypothetical protein